MRAFSLLSLCAGLSLLGCGPAKTKPDAGPDTSCGLDCVAQNYYGLIKDKCFEYTDDPVTAKSPPTLGVWVRDLFTLEGGVQVFPVEYRVGGQTLQTDYFTLKNGELTLIRRAAGSGSVSYRTGTALTGVKWLGQDTLAGENFSTSADAYLSKDDSTTATQYRVTTDTPTTAEKKTPAGTFDTAFKMIFGETPDHGSDSRRVFMPGLGFTIIASPFNLAGGTPTPQYLQRVRDLGTADAGPEACSLGVP